MDNNWFGTWTNCIKEGLGDEIINIIDKGDYQKLLLTYKTSGYFNCEPNEWKFEDDTIIFTINDVDHRAIYSLKLQDNSTLVGTYRQYGKVKDIVYKKTSQIPTDGEFYYDPPNPSVPKSNLSKIDLLKMYSVYENEECNLNFSYNLDEQDKYSSIITEYGIDEFTRGKKDIDLMFTLLKWICSKFHHNGQSYMPDNRNAIAIIEYCKNNDDKIYCRGLALLLAELCRAYNIKAKHITCMPYEEPFDDCHVIVHAYSDRLKQWIMMDPTYCLYLRDKKGKYLNFQRLRQLLIEGKDVFANEEANYNGYPFDMKYYREYMTKNTLRFQCGTDYYFGAEDGRGGKKRVVLLPKNYEFTSNSSDNYFKNSFIVRDDCCFWE